MSKLYVVGLGPGDYEDMTVRADRALRDCDAIIGYHVYVDLVKNRYPDKRTLTTPMTKEADRCRMALEAAAAGENVALVCSGDSGVYGMAALMGAEKLILHKTAMNGVTVALAAEKTEVRFG